MDFSKLTQQLAENGGFSVDVRTGNTPGKGRMVARAGSEAVFPGIPSPRDIDAYARQHMRDLSQPGRYLGGWHDAESGQTYVDISDRFDDPQQSDNALNANAQLAGFDTASGQVYDTPPRLFTPEGEEQNVGPHRVKRRDGTQMINEAQTRAVQRRTQQRLF